MTAKKLIISEFETIDDFMETQVHEYDCDADWITQLEEEYPDTSVHFDVNLEELTEGTLIHNGFTEEQVSQMNSALYGNFLDLYRITKDNLHVMIVGVR